jgi:NADPH:quinone reductase-like Zn-dependent oxidoreductase
MKLRYRILSVIIVLLALGVLAGGIALSYTSGCGPSPPLAAGTTSMKAIVHRCYGSPDVIRYENIAKPVPADNEILVRVHAASINPLDWHYLEGTPYMVRLDGGLGKPANPRLGVDFSGTVESVGSAVTRFKPGEEVFGGKLGALAEYVAVREDRAIALKPPAVRHEQAAAVAIAALTALQGLRDEGHIRAGEEVLINGASGGVGTFAVQIAKSFGAHVTGVCSTRNLQLVRSIGADQVIDYTREDLSKGTQKYDLILDTVSTHSLSEYRRILKPDGVYVLIGSTDPGRWFGWLWRPLQAWVISHFTTQKLTMILADLNRNDLGTLADLMQSGKVTPVIDRTYKLSESADALRYLEKGHARGKVVVVVD